MNQPQPLKQIVSVTEMARLCRLSRARFYQLVSEGIFPKPSRNDQTGRPFFDREQQEQCLQVRRSNTGANRKAVMSCGCRPEALPSRPKRKRLPNSKPAKHQTREEPVITELRHGLAQLGMTNVTDKIIREALSTAYPDGHRSVESADLLRSVFGELQRRDSTDNLSG